MKNRLEKKGRRKEYLKRKGFPRRMWKTREHLLVKSPIINWQQIIGNCCTLDSRETALGFVLGTGV